ncbi:hypothetical protein CEXT_460331 [Caerostris extrusa]|uniref:Uncharacterized protein n=1 Tax=Caerostris extrusa TaxID=172846 RepID=A0AAV4Y0P8_CAEEX|nr:hypothetical protein CEXT_460331 [Caerostris extrusa]
MGFINDLLGNLNQGLPQEYLALQRRVLNVEENGYVPRDPRGPGRAASLTLERLQPATEYQLYLVAFALSGHPANISGKVHFVSPDATQNDSWSGRGGDGAGRGGGPHPLHGARGGSGDCGAGAGRLGVRHRALLQQVGQDPHAGALPAPVPLAPRHRQAQPTAPQRRPGAPRAVQHGVRGGPHPLPPAQDAPPPELRVRGQPLQEQERLHAVGAPHAQEGEERRGPQVACHTGGRPQPAALHGTVNLPAWRPRPTSEHLAKDPCCKSCFSLILANMNYSLQHSPTRSGHASLPRMEFGCGTMFPLCQYLSGAKDPCKSCFSLILANMN